MRALQATAVGTWLVAATALAGCVTYHGVPEEVRFVSSDGVELAGTLVFPARAARPVPAVILLHGAEAATRSFVYRMHANIFLDREMAVLLYDKRGAGESGGDHDSATFARLVEDALAAVRLLRDREDVDAAGIGLIGASQSGWLTPEIAERAGAIAFIVNKVGPCASWRETVAWEVYNEIVDEGVDADSAREQAAVYERLWAYYVSPTPGQRIALSATLREWAQREDSRLPATLEIPDPDEVRDMGYDPGPYLERATTPSLYVYGAEDVNVPTASCVQRLTGLRADGRPVSVHVFEGAGHELGGVGLTGYRFVDGYEQLLGRFARAHVPAGQR